MNTYTLTKPNDPNFQVGGSKVSFITFDDEGKYKSHSTEPLVGSSLFLNGIFNYSWQTTDIEEIIEQTDDCLKFRTKNSIYELKISNSNLEY
jgi:hypothetical protein